MYYHGHCILTIPWQHLPGLNICTSSVRLGWCTVTATLLPVKETTSVLYSFQYRHHPKLGYTAFLITITSALRHFGTICMRHLNRHSHILVLPSHTCATGLGIGMHYTLLCSDSAKLHHQGLLRPKRVWEGCELITGKTDHKHTSVGCLAGVLWWRKCSGKALTSLCMHPRRIRTTHANLTLILHDGHALTIELSDTCQFYSNSMYSASLQFTTPLDLHAIVPVLIRGALCHLNSQGAPVLNVIQYYTVNTIS